MDYKKKFILFVFGLIIVSSLFMVSAASVANILLPATNFTNVSSTYILNVSILDGGTAANLTGYAVFYYQAWGTSTWTQIANTTNVTSNQWYFNASWDTTAVSDAKNYTINATVYNYASAAVNATNITGNTTVDNTAPTIKIYSGSTLTALTNGTVKNNATLTGSVFPNNLTLNISITDATIGLYNTSVWYCFANIAGASGQNRSVPVELEPAGVGWCNFSNINITGLSDGNQTINVYLNDSLNNMGLNNTWVVQVDTAAPTATATCSPSTVSTGSSFPCACTGSDSTSGVNTSTGTTTSTDGVSSSPGLTGVFIYTCNVTDYGGLFSSATATYTVTSHTSTNSVTSPSSNPSSTNYVAEINPGSSQIIKNTDSSIGVKQIEINVNNKAQNVKVTITKYDSKPAAVSVEKTGKVFEYLHFDTQNLLDNLNNATVTFRINKSWVSDNGLTKEDVVISKFNESENKWNDLTTAYDSEDDNYYYYDVNVNSFSYFAISGQAAVSGNESGNYSINSNLTWLWVLLGIAVVGAIAWLYLRNKRA